MKSTLRINKRTRFLVECALSCAMGYVLSYIKVFTMPRGGSVTLAPVAIIMVSLTAGFKAGAVAGALLGLLKIITGGHIIGWVQAALDYPVAYSALAAAAFTPRKDGFTIVVYSLAAFALKTAAHIYSGYLFFGGSLKTSLVYNLSHSLPEAALCSLALYALIKKGAIVKLKADF